MRLFRRSDGSNRADNFWHWWGGARDRVAQAIDRHALNDALAGEITRAVKGIHPEMAWELGAGREARFQFCVSPEGKPHVRQAALKWIEGAPAADETWEYYASRQASPDAMTLEAAGWRIDFNEMRAIASWDAVRRRVDVHLWHPVFDKAPHEVKLNAAFLFLDGLLGEDEVERWIGRVDLLDAPTGGRIPSELKEEVRSPSGRTGG